MLHLWRLAISLSNFLSIYLCIDLKIYIYLISIFKDSISFYYHSIFQSIYPSIYLSLRILYSLYLSLLLTYLSTKRHSNKYVHLKIKSPPLLPAHPNLITSPHQSSPSNLHSVICSPPYLPSVPSFLTPPPGHCNWDNNFFEI